MTNSEVLNLIAEILNGEDWNADTLEIIANVLRSAGYTISDDL